MIVEGKSALDAVKQNMRGPYGFLLNRQRPQSEANVGTISKKQEIY